jgi:hypothetical protein
VYKPGKSNKGADALSRIHEGGELNVSATSLQWKDADILREEFDKDEHLQKIVASLQQNPNAKPGFEFKPGVLLYEGRLVISSNSTLIPSLWQEFHSSPCGEHSGFYRTYRRVAANVY